MTDMDMFDGTDNDWLRTSKWFKRMQSLTPEERKEHLDLRLAEGRRQAERLIGWHGEPTMTVEEIREMLAKEYPGLSLSEQIIKDRKAGF